MKYSFLLLRTALSLLLTCFIGASAANPNEVISFELDSDLLESGQNIDLNGQWWFTFGEQIPMAEVRQRVKQEQMNSIPVPQSWNDIVKPLTDDPYQHGIATYALPVSFSKTPESSLSIKVGYIVGGYRLFWLPDGSNEVITIGTSGDWQSGKYSGLEVENFHFPGNSNGLLVVHVAKQNVYYGGIRHPVSIQRSDVLLRNNNQNLILRSLLIGSMFIMCIHYLIQYRYSRENISALLLSILCLSSVIRSVSTAGFIELFLMDWTSLYYLIRIKVEFMSILFLPVIYFVFLNSMLPKIVPTFVIRIAIVSLIMGLAVTMALSTSMISKSLTIYQGYLVFWALYVIWLIIYGVIYRVRFAWQILVSTLIVAAGGVNDIIASRSSFYNVYLAEYVFFIFLFFQAQLVGQQLRDSHNKSVLLAEEKQQLQQAHTKAVKESQKDHLTGLSNRLALKEMLAQLARTDFDIGATTGVILFDLDHFKTINDTYGHNVGDDILVFVSTVLNEQTLRANDFKCRYGGEEFLLILPGANMEKTIEVAENIRSKLESSVAYAIDDLILNITASFGVAIHHSNQAETLKNLIAQADEALYRAKDKGRNCVSV